MPSNKALREQIARADRSELLRIAYDLIDGNYSQKDLIWHTVNTEYNWKLVETGEPRVLLTDDELRAQLIDDFCLDEGDDDGNEGQNPTPESAATARTNDTPAGADSGADDADDIRSFFVGVFK